MRALLLFIFICVFAGAQAQGIPTNRQAANHYIGLLKDGALVVRLKTNDKSIRAYRNAGNTKLADKLEREASERNLQIMRAFTQRFHFARIYFIEAKSTQRLLRHERNIFLNGLLQIDSSIALHSDSFLFCDYSTLMQNEAMNSFSGDAKRDRESGTPTSNMAMLILDTNGVQLADPFPYSALVVDLLKAKGSKLSKYNLSDSTDAKELLESPELDQLDKYELAVRSLNNRLIRHYNNILEKQGGREIHEKEWWQKHNPNESWRNAELLRIEQRLQSYEKAKPKFTAPN